MAAIFYSDSGVLSDQGRKVNFMADIFTVEKAQLQRLMTLCRYLQPKSGTPITHLIKKGKASRRTIYRDFLSLKDFGIKVELGKGGYYIRQSTEKCKQLFHDNLRKSLEKMISSCM